MYEQLQDRVLVLNKTIQQLERTWDILILYAKEHKIKIEHDTFIKDSEFGIMLTFEDNEKHKKHIIEIMDILTLDINQSNSSYENKNVILNYTIKL